MERERDARDQKLGEYWSKNLAVENRLLLTSRLEQH